MAAMDFWYGVAPALIVIAGAAVAWLAARRLITLRKRTLSPARRVGEGLVLFAVALVAAAAAVSSGMNAAILAWYHARIPGRTFQVNGRTMRIDCTGGGSPTLVLDAGLGNDGLIWSGVQPVLARTTQVCSYDRAGFGGSQPAPGPADADHVAVQLHGLLTAAGIKGPIILMGHSIAGLYIRDYSSRFPAQVVGLVFVDGATPLQDRDPAFAPEFRKPPIWQLPITRLVFALGLPRLLGQCSQPFPGFGPWQTKLQDEDLCSENFGAVKNEQENFDRSGEETLHTGPYGNLPVLIFSQDTQLAARLGEPPAIGAAWNRMQENLKGLSTRSRRIIARGSPHYIQLQRPGLVEREVANFIGEVRDGTTPKAGWGSTVVR